MKSAVTKVLKHFGSKAELLPPVRVAVTGAAG